MLRSEETRDEEGWRIAADFATPPSPSGSERRVGGCASKGCSFDQASRFSSVRFLILPFLGSPPPNKGLQGTPSGGIISVSDARACPAPLNLSR